MKRYLLVIFIVAITLLQAEVARACSCDGVSQREAFRKAKAVFVGQAVNHLDNPDVKVAGYLIVRFKVEKSWKGAKKSEIVIASTFGSPSLCGGFHIEEGKRYLIYAYREGEELIAVTTCDRSTPIEYADKDINNLNSFWYRLGARMYPF